MNDVTRILSAIEQGDPHAAEQLLPLVYDELRKLAAEKMAHETPARRSRPRPWSTRRIFGWWTWTSAQQWNSRGHFFAAAAEAMRRILVEQARRKQADKHGGGRLRVDLPADLAALRSVPTTSSRGRGAQPVGTSRPRRGPVGGTALLRRPVSPGRGRGAGHQPRCRRPWTLILIPASTFMILDIMDGLDYGAAPA